MHLVRGDKRMVGYDEALGGASITCDAFECAGRGTRIRTRRILLETSYGQDLHFVPKEWSPEIVEREIAKVWGCRRSWLTWQWNDWTLTAEHSNERPVLSIPCRDRLNELTELLETAPLNGRRGRGPSYALGAEVREVNRLLRLVAPHESWLSFAVVSHHNVNWHVDSMNNEHSFVMTVNGARAYLEVDTDVSCMRRAVCTSDRVVYFDATRRHRVNVAGVRYTRSIVMYSPARLVPQQHFADLIDLGFPIGADGGVYPFAQPFTGVGVTPSPPKRQTDRGDRERSVSGKQARVVTVCEECEDDKETVDYGYGEHRRGIQLSPTIPWQTQDGFSAGAGDDAKVERDELSRLIQWTKGFGSGHSAKQLRMILLGEKKTWKRLVACKTEGDKSKAEILIAAAMRSLKVVARISQMGTKVAKEGHAQSLPVGRRTRAREKVDQALCRRTAAKAKERAAMKVKAKETEAKVLAKERSLQRSNSLLRNGRKQCRHARFGTKTNRGCM
eukprot:3105276-Amphidinium_carterae.4